MKWDLDPDSLRISIVMWRDSVDLKLPMLDEFKVHFMRQRRTSLSSFSVTAKACLMVLRHCKAGDGDPTALRKLLAEVTAFLDWADSAIQQPGQLGAQESVMDQVQDLLKAPKGLRARFPIHVLLRANLV